MLDFSVRGDFYEFQLLWRKKDNPTAPANESQRMLKCWEIDSLQRYDEKVPVMKELAEMNHARLYFIPRVLNRKDVNRDFLVWFAKNIDHTEVKYQNLVRSVIAKCKKTRADRYIVDLDRDEMPDAFRKRTFEEYVAESKKSIGDVLLLRRGPGYTERMFLKELPTPNGCHIVVDPFDRSQTEVEFPFPLEAVKPEATTLVFFNKQGKH